MASSTAGGTRNGGAGAGGGLNWGGSTYIPGSSVRHGDGGYGYKAIAGNATGDDGEFPGGGGGASVVINGSTYTSTSGAGGDGCVRVWTW